MITLNTYRTTSNASTPDTAAESHDGRRYSSRQPGVGLYKIRDTEPSPTLGSEMNNSKVRDASRPSLPLLSIKLIIKNSLKELIENQSNGGERDDEHFFFLLSAKKSTQTGEYSHPTEAPATTPNN